MEQTPSRARLADVLRNRPLLTLMLGHFTVDMYVGLLPVLYPLLTERFTLDLKTVGLVSLAYSGMASLAQPFFGWIADRYGTRFIGAALVWTAALFATIGFAPTFPVLVVLAGLAGLGSGAYHPLGAVNASAVIPEGQRNTAMSVYVTGGTVGVASGPLVGALLFSLFGVRGTALMALPGLSIAAWLLWEMRTIALRRPRRRKGEPAVVHAAVPLVPLLATIGVMMARSWSMIGIQAFVPTWYRQLGYDAAFYGPLATTIVLASALGTIGSGTLADRFGRRAVIVGSLVLTAPAILLFAQFTGPIAFVTGALVGFLAASTGPLMLVTAQQLMVGRQGVASGLILGLGFITGAVGVPAMGALADAFGIPAAMRIQALVAVLTIGLAWLLPTEARLRELTRARQTPSTPEAAPPAPVAVEQGRRI
ncbi:MAG: MFS transporter [Actinomycetota bacterium]|nr:MFS transporter [Actinomycetota bacterium]